MQRSIDDFHQLFEMQVWTDLHDYLFKGARFVLEHQLEPRLKFRQVLMSLRPLHRTEAAISVWKGADDERVNACIGRHIGPA